MCRFNTGLPTKNISSLHISLGCLGPPCLTVDRQRTCLKLNIGRFSADSLRQDVLEGGFVSTQTSKPGEREREACIKTYHL